MVRQLVQCREEIVGCQPLIHTSTGQPLHQRLRENHRRGGGKIVGARGHESLLYNSVPYIGQGN